VRLGWLESALEMAKRHVAEGLQRIAQQEALIAHLEAENFRVLAEEARVSLWTMRDQQKMFERHAAEEREKLRR